MPDRTPFATLLRQRRLSAGLSQETLAERAGLSVDAVAALERGRRTKPRLATVALLADALALDRLDRAALLAAATATVPPAGRAPLPVPETPLIGRERDIAAVARLARERSMGEAGRIVTLTGPGGVGKTRLAVAVAAQETASDVAFVALAALRDPRAVFSTIARVLGVQESGGRDAWAALAARLRERRLLLVLDNFEQVAAAAPALANLVAVCPAVTALVTSRAPLHVRGERRYPVAPLVVPAETRSTPAVSESGAVRLFVARAREALPDFAPGEADLLAVAEICRRLDGLPLAIELAAARLALLPPPILAARLKHRLPLLRGGRQRPARHQTLRATIAWSYDLLTSEERWLFRCLAVFAGGCAWLAIQAVGAAADGAERDDGVEILDGLAALVDQGLLRAEQAAAVGEDADPRFRMLETIREFAQEQLEESGEAATAQRRHAAYYGALAAEVAPQLVGPASLAQMERLELEHDNLRAALDWYAQTDVRAGVDLAGHLAVFWQRRGHHTEGRRRMGQLLAQDAAEPDARPKGARLGKALLGAGILAIEQRDFTTGRTLLEESVARAQEAADGRGVAEAQRSLGLLAVEQGDYAAARALVEQSLTHYRAIDDQQGIGAALAGLGDIARIQGDAARAGVLYAESLTCSRAVGDGWNLVRTLLTLAEMPIMEARYDEAAKLLEEALVTSRALEDPQCIRRAIGLLGTVAINQGKYARARELLEESLALARETGNAWPVASSLRMLGNLAVAQGAHEEAWARYEAGLALFRAGADQQAAGIILGDMGNLAQAQGDRTRARRLWAESATIARERVGHQWLMSWTLGNVGTLLIGQGETVAGVRLVSAAGAADHRFPRSIDPDERAACEAGLAAARAVLGEAAFAFAWGEGKQLTPDQALTAALSSLCVAPDGGTIFQE